MATYDDELLRAARRLATRRIGQRGKLPNARIRRSISTSYYAVFHFLVEEAGIRLVGSHSNLRRRRRVLGRIFTHAGLKAALDKVKGQTADASVSEFLSPPGPFITPVAVPRFARRMASVFAETQTRRHIADYDLNTPLSELDARLIHNRVKRAIAEWRAATTAQDKDFKHALCLLMLLKGKLRQDS
jgi:hypothetical protein